ncbi:MAG: helix-turn-helix domain-containing protein [Desulfovibrio sp.]|jgi:transcriptional regulator with XRE-family HTH domain|nr:helix-turn-helix domain-containing protein [Desulfovibrio sp.]
MRDFKLAEIVGKNISAQRQRYGISQKELAARLGITQDAMNRMEKGIIAPKMSRLPDLADALNCTVPFLFRDHGEESTELAEAIAAILRILPHDGQIALRELVEHTARVMLMRVK